VNELDVARQAARAAAALISVHATGFRRFDRKSGAIDLVTEVDRASEAAIRDVLGRHTPDIPILGEEGGGDLRSTCWVVDPLDGTTNFVHGFPMYAVSIGLVVGGVPTVGVVHDVPRDQVYAAERGRGATRDGSPIAVSPVADLAEALCLTGFPYDRRERAAYYLAHVQKALERTQGIRRSGSAALDLCQVASGRIDVYWEMVLGPWDVAAGAVIVAEAGGRVTDVSGGPLSIAAPRPLATNARLHEAALAMLDIHDS
jgi:myo-inositol-1(or 4)-monophosphatase